MLFFCQNTSRAFYFWQNTHILIDNTFYTTNYYPTLQNEAFQQHHNSVGDDDAAFPKGRSTGTLAAALWYHTWKAHLYQGPVDDANQARIIMPTDKTTLVGVVVENKASIFSIYLHLNKMFASLQGLPGA